MIYSLDTMFPSITYTSLFIFRFDCLPEGNFSEDVVVDACFKKGCCWNLKKDLQNISQDSVPLNIPYCFYPDNYSLYNLTGSKIDHDKETHIFKNIQPSGYPRDVKKPRIEVTCFEKHTLRVRIVDQEKTRYEVPFLTLNDQKKSLEDCDLKFELSSPNALEFRVLRKSNHGVL